MAAVDYTDALDAGWVIFPLHPIVRAANGVSCACGDDECTTAGKHPKASNWQHTQPYNEDQLEYLEDFDGVFFGNQLLDHHGVVVNTSGLLVVDVDGRNGGWPSAETLSHVREKCGYIVKTGSGDGEHWYFNVPDDMRSKSFMGKHNDYPGIDFKSTGFIVGAGCDHASGQKYRAELGSPSTITDAPLELLSLLARTERARVSYEGETNDYTMAELSEIAMAYPNHDGVDYDAWVEHGMALHDAAGGSDEGYQLWVNWSARSGKHNETDMPKKWHSFGKAANPITAGTLIKRAQDNGWTAPVTFVDDTVWDEVVTAPVESVIAPKYDMLNPPGLVGEITKWINERCAFPREKLAVAAALQIVGNIAGLNYLVAETRTTLNLITMAIAGSRTGKGAIKRCMDEIFNEVGLSPSVHGKFKSSQELTRNALHHQPIHYLYDEFGKQLEKLAGAGKSGAHYLEDLMAELIAMYSEATGFHGISGDMKREMAELADKRIVQEIKKADLADGENAYELSQQPGYEGLRDAYVMRDIVERGIYNPFLTFFGLSEPSSFNAAIEKDPWFVTGGLLGRALLFEELENVPMKKPIEETTSDPLNAVAMMQLTAMACGGDSATIAKRIERQGDWKEIGWSKDALKFLRNVEMYWREVALAEQDSGSGLESQAMGAAELMIKVSGILCANKQLIDKESAEWAHELIKEITLDKIHRAKSNEKISSKNNTERGHGLLESLMRHVSSLEHGQHTTAGKARQAVGRTKVTLEQAQEGLDHLAGVGRILVEQKTSGNGRVVTHYKIK